MPELPEVESIKLQLKDYLVGHKIEKVKINYQKCFIGDPKLLSGKKVLDVRRFGKAISIDLSDGLSILIHVKMTGQLIYRGPNLKGNPNLSEKVKGGLLGKHTHVIFYLDKKGVLYYVDYRKFGWIRIVKTKEIKEEKFLKSLGPEPEISSIHQTQDTINLEEFIDLTKKSKKPIKIFLMDQKIISGIGNIYANDALYLAKINPKTKTSKITKPKLTTLFESIQKVLKTGIKKGGASELAFVTPDGGEGNYQKVALVYGKEGEKCKNECGGIIKKIKLGGRGTYFCPKCQV